MFPIVWDENLVLPKLRVRRESEVARLRISVCFLFSVGLPDFLPKKNHVNHSNTVFSQYAIHNGQISQAGPTSLSNMMENLRRSPENLGFLNSQGLIM